MKLLRRILPFLAAGLLAAGAAQAAGTVRPVVVELYTSQGCSSCPPADVLLGKLAQKPGVIAISLPITYWDMLGWKDSLASEANTRRQKAYAAAMGHGGVYTPQIIVDGVSDVVGSRAQSVEVAIAERRAQLAVAQAMMAAQVEARHDMEVARADLAAAVERAQNAGRAAQAAGGYDPIVPVMVRETPQEMHVDVGAAPGAPTATVWMFQIRNAVTVNIPTGENAGHTVVYHNVAADTRAIGVYKGHALSLTLPHSTTPHDGVVVVVQQGGYGHVIGAAYVSRPDYYAAQ